MKNFVLISISLIIGIIIGIAGTVFFYPFLFPPPVINEQVQNVAQKQLFATGTFIHPNPADKLHWGKGKLSIYQQGKQYEVFLNKDFEVGPGPAFYVYLSTQANIKTKDQFKQLLNTNKIVDLGALKSFKGSQVYAIPNKVDMQTIKSVVVWCRSFKQLITSANLQKSGAQ